MNEMKLINYRTASHVVTAEFLLDLYAQRNPRLNPFVFDNVVVEMAGDEVRSYAAAPGWLRLRTLLGQRLLSDLDSVRPTLEEVLRSPRPLSRGLLERVERVAPAELSNQALIAALMELHYTALSEIYEVNLVQLEQGLHEALTTRARQLGLNATEARREVLNAVKGSTATQLAAFESSLRDRVSLAGEMGAGLAIGEAFEDFHAFAGGYGAAVSRDAFIAAATAILADDRLRTGPRRGGEETDDTRLIGDRLFRELAELAVELGDRRDSNKALLGSLNRHKERILHEIRQRLDLSVGEFRWMLLEEIQLALLSGVLPTEEDLRTRAKAGIRLRREQTQAIRGAELTREVGGGKTAELYGVPASRGVYTGRVCVIHSGADISKMRKGDILVAAGTDFDMLLLVRLAGAIVTEEGGMLSHAAVVSRELEIPAVIGLDDAPMLLQDGETITVDADEGRILRRMAGSDSENSRTCVSREGARTCVDLSPLSAALGGEFGGKSAGLAQLSRLGLQMPSPVRLLAHDALKDPVASAVAIARAYPDQRVCLRSSANVEDQATGSAAGIFVSKVGVDTSNLDALVDALNEVRDCGPGETANAYLHRRGRAAERVRVHVVVHPYLEAEYRGTAISSWGARGDVIAEVGIDTDSLLGQESKPFKRVRIHLRTGDQSGTSAPGYAGTFAELGREMKRIENVYGTPVECEFGVREGELYFLQVRKVVAS